MRHPPLAGFLLSACALTAQVPSDLRLTGLLQDQQQTTVFLSRNRDTEFLSLSVGESAGGVRLLKIEPESGVATLESAGRVYALRLGGGSPAPLAATVPVEVQEPMAAGRDRARTSPAGPETTIVPERELAATSGTDRRQSQVEATEAKGPETQLVRSFSTPAMTSRSEDSLTPAGSKTDPAAEASWRRPQPPTEGELFKIRFGYTAAEARDRELRRQAGLRGP